MKKKYMNKYNNDFSKPNNLKRKELAKFYHIWHPKKYSYSGEKLETVNNIDNHQYIEIIGPTDSKDKNSNKISRMINSKDNINKKDINPNDDKVKIKISKYNPNINKKNNALFDSRYKSYQNSPRTISRNNTFYISKASGSQLKPKIIKETKNTRLIESKDLKESPLEKYLSSENINQRNNNLNLIFIK